MILFTKTNLYHTCTKSCEKQLFGKWLTRRNYIGYLQGNKPEHQMSLCLDEKRKKHTPYFLDHKAHIKTFNFLNNQKCTL